MSRFAISLILAILVSFFCFLGMLYIGLPGKGAFVIAVLLVCLLGSVFDRYLSDEAY